MYAKNTNVKGFYKEQIPVYFECFCGILLQSMLLIGFVKDPLKCFRNSSVPFVANLAFADLCVCLKPLLTIAFDPDHVLMEFLDDASILASVLTILSIATDRFLLVTYPLKQRLLMNKTKVMLWVMIIWILAALDPLKAHIVSNAGRYDFIMVHFVYLVVALATFTIYLATWRNISKHSNSLNLQENNSVEYRAQQLRYLNQKRFLKTIIIIGSVAAVTILPQAIFGLVELLKDEQRKMEGILGIAFYTIMIANFVINPVIYFWRLPKYRRTFFIIYTCRKLQ